MVQSPCPQAHVATAAANLTLVSDRNLGTDKLVLRLNYDQPMNIATIPAMMPVMTITMISSISVKPRSVFP